jgi:adenylyltransferase/sulfurtransferase
VNGGPQSLPDPAATMEISVAAVAAWHSRPPGERPRLIDCREADELAICRIAGNEWVPLGSLPRVAAALAADSPRGAVIYCHHGMRSLRAASILRESGLQSAFSMAGGIEEWSRSVDPDVARY